MWKRRWFRGICPTVCRVATLCSESSVMAVRETWEKSDCDVVIVKTQWTYTSRHGSSSAPGELVVRIPLASSGVEWWIQVVQSETENDEMEKVNERERGV